MKVINDTEQNRVVIDYTNHRGVRSSRVIVPEEIVFCPFGTEFHPHQPGWYLRAFDVAKEGHRDFAMSDIHQWVQVK